jgi:hypothetical protein
MFTPEALNRQAKARWNATTREADSETDMDLANLLAEDDDLNFTNEPTLEKPKPDDKKEDGDPVVTMNIPGFPSEHIPTMAQDGDSISTFHPGKVMDLTNKDSIEEEATGMQTPQTPTSIMRPSRQYEKDGMSRMSMSDSASRISSLETELSTMHKNFQGAIEQLQSQAQDQAIAQVHQSSLLEEIIKMLKKTNNILSSISNSSVVNTPNQSEVANHPQTSIAGDSDGVTGQG